MSGSWRDEIVTSADRMRDLEAPWWGLFARCPAATPFQSPAWLLAWWGTFAPGMLATVAVWDGETLVGLAPLYREAGGTRLLPLGIGLSDHLDLLVDREAGEAVSQRLLAALDRLPGWTAIVLDDLAPGSAALLADAPSHWQEERRPGDACPVLDIPSGAVDLASFVPAAKLRKLRMARHRTARRAGAIEAADAGSALDVFDDLVRLHAARWEGRGEPGVLADPRVVAFHREALPGLVAHDLLRSYRLMITGTVAAVFHGFARDGGTYAYLGGFDPAFAFESPGTLLAGHALDRTLREGGRSFSFLRGREAYKYEWGAVDRVNTTRCLTRA